MTAGESLQASLQLAILQSRAQQWTTLATPIACSVVTIYRSIRVVVQILQNLENDKTGDTRPSIRIRLQGQDIYACTREGIGLVLSLVSFLASNIPTIPGHRGTTCMKQVN